MKFSNDNIKLLLSLFSQYLSEHVNKGIYHGISGSYIETVMKINIGNEMITIILNSLNSQN